MRTIGPFLTYTNLAVPYALNGNVDDAKTARAEASPFVSGVRFGVSSDRFPRWRRGVNPPNGSFWTVG
jgi:hypothetical protein